MATNTIGLDIAKSVFQVHIESGEGQVVLQKTLRRSQVEAFFAKQDKARIGIEACGTAHYWARVLRAMGHEVLLIPAAYVKPFVKRNKTDARDAAAICAAMGEAGQGPRPAELGGVASGGRPDMRFVAIKSKDQQASRALERSRDLAVRQHTQLSNSLRSQLAEFGIIAAQGQTGFRELRKVIDDTDPRLPELLLFALKLLLAQIDGLADMIAALKTKIETVAQADPVMRRLRTVPAVGWLTAHAVVAAVGEGTQFATARDFAAWVGLTPRQHSSAGKQKACGLSRQGDKHLRKLFALGASTLMRPDRIKKGGTAWQRGILARRPVKVAVLAQAAKTARIVWAELARGHAQRSWVGWLAEGVLTSGKPYRSPTEDANDTAPAAALAAA